MRPFLAHRCEANLVWLDEVDSSNDVAARVVSGWSSEDERRLIDTVIVAGCQIAGRGRGRHAWFSPEGGLYATWLAWLSSDVVGTLPLAAGASLAEALEEVPPHPVARLKWPNDVIVGGSKLAGILCQSRTRGEWCWVAVGFGVNVGVVPELDGSEKAPATSLRELGADLPAEDVGRLIVDGFLRRMRPYLEDREKARESWSVRTAHSEGEVLRVRSAGEVVEGAFSGFDRHGHLVIVVDGVTRTIAAGELVTPLPAMGGREDAPGS